MSAPNGTVWGPIVTGSNSGRKVRIGIFTSVSNTDTITTINVQVWFWTIYSCADGSNYLYFDIGGGVSEAVTYVGSASVDHKVSSGEGWNSANQTKIWDRSYSYTRNANNQACNIFAKYNGIDMLSGKTMYADTSVTIPSLASYTVSYNANGGSGAPASQTKYYGQTLRLSSVVPTRTGYIFKGWANSSGATSVSWPAGASYTDNASVTLYAVWEAIKYTVSYNANGGSGAPASQTKIYGQDLVLSSVVPAKSNYNFKGWSESSAATVASYSAGGTYTSNSSTTLYAVWGPAYIPPRISNLTIKRVDASGSINDFGTKVRVAFEWATDKTPVSISVKYKQTSWSSWYSIDNTYQNVSGREDVTTTQTISPEESCDIKIEINDGLGSSVFNDSVPCGHYIIDCQASGNGIAFGKVSSVPNTAEFGWPIYDVFGTRVSNGVTDASKTEDPNTTLSELILTNKNTPEAGTYMYIRTIFYEKKTTSANRSQIAIPYSSNMSAFHRYYVNGEWSKWLTTPCVIDEGVTGRWRWRIWSDGKKECWGLFSVPDLYIDQAWGSIFYATWMNEEANKAGRAYPFAFTEDPIVSVSYARSTSGDAWLISDSSDNVGTAKTHAPAMGLARPTKGNIRYPEIHYYVVGY